MDGPFAVAFHSLTMECDGVRYSAQVEQGGPHAFRFVHLYDMTHQSPLLLNELEAEYIRRKGTYGGTALHSKWATRRRLKQYVRLWLGYQQAL